MAVTRHTYVLTRPIRVLFMALYRAAFCSRSAMFRVPALRFCRLSRNNPVSLRLAQYQQSNISACRQRPGRCGCVPQERTRM